MMQAQILGPCRWVRLVNEDGSYWFTTDTDCEGVFNASKWEYVDEQFGARLSMPGYLDCTEWTVFDTHEEARAFIEEEWPEEAEEGIREL